MSIAARWVQFSGFMDDEVGKLASFNSEDYQRLMKSDRPEEEMQRMFNKTSLDALNSYLLNAAFFLEPQLVVDGWYILTPSWWESFSNQEVNLLPHMLESGLCLSFTRGGALSEVGYRSEKQVASYRYLRQHDPVGYETVTTQIGTNFDNAGKVRTIPWPKYDFDDILRNILRSMVLKDRLQLGLDNQRMVTDAVWQELVETFDRNLDKKDSARQAWTSACLIVTKRHSLPFDSLKEINALGTNAYHWSRALAMNYDADSTNCTLATVATDTYNEHADLPDITPVFEEYGDPIITLSLDWSEFQLALQREKKMGSDRLLKLFAQLNSGVGIGAKKSRFLAARRAALREPRGFGNYYDAAADYADTINKTFKVKPKISGNTAKIADAVAKSVLRNLVSSVGSNIIYSVYAAASQEGVNGFTGAMSSGAGAFTILQESFHKSAQRHDRTEAYVRFRSFREQLFRDGHPKICPRDLKAPNDATRAWLFKDVREYKKETS